MEKRKDILTSAMLIGAAVTILLAGFKAFAEDCEKTPEKLYRLHITANSDSEYDQEVKYNLRDYLMDEFSDIFSGCTNAADAAAAAAENLPEIENRANAFLKSSGCEYKASVKNTEMFFTSRNYGNFTVPAGIYKALKIDIGSGEGRNWWCVMFPPLCLRDYAKEKKEISFINRDILKRPQPLYEKDENAKIETNDGLECRFAVYDFLYGLFFK